MVSRTQHQLGRAIEPQFLVPVLALVGLSAIWGTTLGLIRIERANAERTAVATTKELVETYEAQVVRAVREIDHTLKVVRYAFQHHHHGDLEELRRRALLPPDLLFVVTIVDSSGDVVASTRPLPRVNVADREYFLAQLGHDELAVGVPRRDPSSGEWVLRFSRRLEHADGSFAGVALVSVDAGYFVSGYDPRRLGEGGVLGVLGTDGVLRARRSGDEITHGETVDYATAVQGADGEEIQVALVANPWDGVRRYTGARQLYDAPLTVVVGLSEAERLAAADARARVYSWRAAAASTVLVVVLVALGRLAWQLAWSRRRAVATKLEYARQIEDLAYHDDLTGLPNRGLFSQLLQQGIQQARRHGRSLAVLFLDLDRFKHINDTLGHEAGDQLLQEVARRLKASLRESDSVARLGGDEFVVLLPELADETYAANVAHKMIASIARPFILLGQEFRVTGSVGIALHPRDGLDEQTLTKNADIAMYKAKEQGKNTFQFYSETMNSESLERLTLESSLRHALENEEFVLHYQAKRDLRSGRITGMEALLRWQHPDLGLVAPLQFIAAAEQTGLIVPIGTWVLKSACRQNVEWVKAGLPRMAVAVNLTERQFFDEHLLADLTEILATAGMEANLLELEIAERMLMSDVERTVRILTGLKELGVRVAVDDFGVGYSTISGLKRFPLDTIKIDRSFIRDVTRVAEDRALTEAIIALGRSLSLTVVAQGVETQEQVDYLREHACDELQGFYLNRPVPAVQFADVLRAQASAPEVREIAAHRVKKLA